MSAPVFQLDDVTVSYGETIALEGVSLTVLSGDLTVVIGPDGAGKSTLLRILAGLEIPRSGRRRTGVERGRLGYAGARFDLYGDLTVSENIAFFARLRGLDETRVRGDCERMLVLTSLGEARDRLAGRLSGGMKKKLSLAVALVYQPEAVLLDEPTVGVDPISRRELWDILAEANAWGTSVFYTSPYLDEAVRARRVILLTRGRAAELGTEELLERVSDWRAWAVETTEERPALRSRLAGAGLGPRVYLRPEGLTVLARGESEARFLAGQVLGEPAWGPPRMVVPQELSLDDAFVLLDSAEDGGEVPGAGSGDRPPAAPGGRRT